MVQEPISKQDKSEIHKTELTRIAKGASISFVGKIFDGSFRYLYLIIVAKILGVESFGVFMLGLTIITIAGIISRLGLEIGVVRYVSLYNGIKDKARIKGTIVQSLKCSFVTSALVGVVLFFTAELLSVKMFKKPELEPIIKLLSFSIPFLSTALVALACTQGFQIMKYMVYGKNIFWPLSNILLVISLSWAGLKLRGVAIAYVMSVFLTCILSVYFLTRSLLSIRHVVAIRETKKLLRFSIPLLTVAFFGFLILWTDTLMLGAFRSSEEVGIYNVAIRTALLIFMILASFNSIFAPVVANLYNKGEMQKLSGLLKSVTKWTFTICLPIFLLMALLSKEIMAIFGQEFVGGCTPFIILAFAQLVNAGMGPVGLTLTMSGKQDLMMYNTFGICLVNGLLNYLLIPSFGMTGASIASGLSLIIFNIVTLSEVYALLKMHPYSRKFFKPAVSAIIASGVILLMRHMLPELSGTQKMLIHTTVFSGVFTSLICWGGIDEETKLLVNVLKKNFLKATGEN